MNPFFESFQKEIGKKSAQIIIAIIVIFLLAAAKLLPEYMAKLRLLSIFLLAILLLALASGLFYRYFSKHTPKKLNKSSGDNISQHVSFPQNEKINFNTCDWLPDPGVWKHKKTGVLFCQKCHSPLSSDLYCATCDRGFGKGEVFSLDDD